MIDLDALAQAASCLEPLPNSVVRLATLVCDESPDLSDLVDVVQYDQALTAVLLRSANSAWSASRSQVNTVKDAVVRLGSGPVLSIALGVNVRGRMMGSVPEYGLGEGDLWTHSVASSLAAELLVRRAPRRPPPETVTASLLHDIGKLIMCRFLPVDLLELIRRAMEEGGLTHIRAEQEVLGVDHGELGGLVAQTWGLPETLVRGIAHHHSPAIGGAPVCYATLLADIAAKVVGAGLDANPDLEAFLAAMAELGLGVDDFDDLCRDVDERFVEVCERYS